MIIWVVKITVFLCVYSCHLFLISSFSVRSLQFLSFIEPIFAWNVPFVSLVFLKRSLVFPILLFSSISLHWSLRKGFLSLLAILWNCIQMGISFLFSFAFHFPSFTAVCKASSDSHFVFLHFFFLGMVLITVSCTMSGTSVHSSSGILSVRYIPLSLFLTSPDTWHNWRQEEKGITEDEMIGWHHQLYECEFE